MEYTETTDGEGVEATARIAPFITKRTRDKKCQQIPLVETVGRKERTQKDRS